MKTKTGEILTGEELWNYYVKERRADHSQYGGFHQEYGAMVGRVFGIRGKRVLDVGCACGAMTKGFLDAGADAYGIDPEMCFIRRTISGMEGRVIYWPPDEAVFAPAAFDLVHSSQVLEHVDETRVEKHLAACYAALKPGGVMYASLVFEGDADPYGDVTHTTIKPRDWWSGKFAECRFRDVSNDFREAIEAEAMQQEYRWNWIVCRKENGNKESGS